MRCWEFLWIVLKLKCTGPCGLYHRLNKCYFWPYFKASLIYWSYLSLESPWEMGLGLAGQLGLMRNVRPALDFGLWIQRSMRYLKIRIPPRALNIGPNFIINPVKSSLCWQIYEPSFDLYNQHIFTLYAHFLTSFSFIRSCVIWYFYPTQMVDCWLVYVLIFDGFSFLFSAWTFYMFYIYSICFTVRCF